MFEQQKTIEATRETDSKIQESLNNTRKITEKMKDKSRYKIRTKGPSGREAVCNPEQQEVLTIEQVKDPDSPKVEKIFKFCEKHFGANEIDSLDQIKRYVQADTDCYAIVEDSKKEIISLTQGSCIELTPENEGDEPKERIAFIGYSVTEEHMRRQDLANESVRFFYEFAQKKAQENGQELKAILAEAVESSESAWNKLGGMKRSYWEDNDGHFHEVPYICPPLQWDMKTGMPLDPETGEIGQEPPSTYSAPEHLMIKMIDGRNEMTAKELIPMIRAVYENNYFIDPDTCDENEKPTEEALKKNEEIVEQFITDLNEVLKQAKDGKIVMMDRTERNKKIEELKAQGKEFHEMKNEDDEVFDGVVKG